MSRDDIEQRITNAVYTRLKKDVDAELKNIYAKIERLEDAIIRVADNVREDRKNKKEQMQLTPVNQQQMIATLQTHSQALLNIKAQLKELTTNGEEMLYDYHQSTVSRGGTSGSKMRRGDTFFSGD